MKKRIASVVCILVVCVVLGCLELAGQSSTQDKNDAATVKQLTVINCITGDTVLELTGEMTIVVDTENNQLKVVVDKDGSVINYSIGLSNIIYVVEDCETTKETKGTML